MKRLKVNLALQGGGAHGAFTWGVLDRLLDEDWLEIAAISGTSAGALNAAALKSGLIEGDVRAGFDLTGHFLEQFVFHPQNKPLPPARVWMLDKLGDAGRL